MTAERTGLDETEYSLIEHLDELRSRLIKSVIAVLLTTAACAVYAEPILQYSIRPLQAVLEDRNRVETLLVDSEDSETREAISSLDRVRFKGSHTTLEEAASRVRSLASSRRTSIDLVLVSTASLPLDGTLLSDLIEGVERTPEVSYMVTDPKARIVPELQLEGAQVILAPPKPAVLKRLVRRAAASAGKASSGDSLVVLSPLEPFFAYIKIALVCGLFLACPLWIYQAWAFIAPGLYRHERLFALPVVLSGSLLFVGGGLFAYYAMFPLMFDVLVNQMLPDSLMASFTVDKYLGLLLRVTVAFGVVFELPLALAMMSAVGIVNARLLRRFRKYAYVGAFVLGAILTPADPLSQAMMAVPLIIFYEVGIWLAVIFGKRARPGAEQSLTHTDDD